ncbi:hypothetical protein TVAG_410380 [Trichomonas vaginalis G3]|uniref:Uncharacterized protein n=1 Tax=Trichomonas vaginalis (strain ATCC PRA-98 / G3) TaxID=412133 RepID=A2E8J8_TRIV3|nr:armadillo (ARM) repeat-containing protein family [Trichomonas vaginalis G3]EAY11035.1 hypothetical protein TVAG_410380 [Trichomonas vaginalis G3]KAI5531791.1 armadillo (ARM) repeat-containing protein family [Trichomonas vaginalis G3]|eukprot:XP_001323258.1 hypothetical protein [Trichomonas vaginalis G3]
MNETDLSNVYPHIFNCFSMIFKISPNFPSMLFLYLNGLHCENEMIQKNILKTLQRLFIEHDFMRYAFSNLAKALDGFTSLYLKSESSEIKFLTLKAMTLLYSVDEKMTMKYNLSISTIINEEVLENQKMDFITIDFINQLLTIIFDISIFNEDFLKSGSHQIVYPQILVMLFKYANDFKLPENYLPKLFNSMIEFPNSLSNIFGVASWLYYFTLFIKNYHYEPKLFSTLLKQSLMTKDEKYEILFSILNPTEILTILALLIEEIDDLEAQNEMYLVRLCKISCMFLQKNKNEEFVGKTAKILGFLFNKNMSLNISINDKKINVLTAFTNIVGLYPNATKEIYEKIMSKNNESAIVELAEAMISKPVEYLFDFDDFVFKPDEKLVLIENKTAFYDLTEFNKKSYESKILQQKKIFYSFLRLVKTDGGP